MNGMNHDETILRLIANNGIYTNALAEVIEISKGRFCRMKLVSATVEEFDLPIINVPVGRLVGTSQAVKVGMILPVYFSKWALSEIFVNKKKVATKGPLVDLQFNRDAAYALPIVFDDKLDVEFPNILTIHDKATFESPVSMSDTLDVDGVIKSLEDVLAKTVSLLEHVHTYTKPGSASEFSGTPKE